MSDSSSEFDTSRRTVEVRRPPSNPSRKGFLSFAGRVVAGLAAKAVTGVPSVRVLEHLAAGVDDSSKGNEAEGQVASNPIAPIQAENMPGKHAAFGLFRGLTTEDAQELNDKVNGFVTDLINLEHRDIPRFRKQAEDYLKIVTPRSSENGFRPENMLGIIFTESRFDPNAENVVNEETGEKAVGLCGLKVGVAGDYELETSEGNDQRVDPEKNIAVASKYMGDNKKLFVDESLAIWAHHAGPGNVMNAISIEIGDPTFSLGDYGDALKRKDYRERERIEKLVAAYIRRNDLNFYKLMKNEKVVSWIKGNRDLEDETLNYPYRVLAGAVVLGYAKF